MSRETKAAADLRVKYVRGVHEDGREREQSEVEVLEDGEQLPDLSLQRAGKQTQKNLPAVNRRGFRAFEVMLGVMYLLILAGVVIRYISVTLEKDQLKNKVSANKSQLQDEVKSLNTETHELKTNNSQLQDEVKRLNTETHVLRANNSELQDEVKRLNTETHVLKTYNSQLQDEVKRLNKETHELKTNNSQLQDEMKKLNDATEGKLCPEEWKRLGSSCYFKFTGEKTWDESRTDCQSKGADLVTINNKEEQEFVRSLSMNEESWIGLQNTWTSQGWKWVDGSPLTVTFWASGEPQYNYAVCCNQQGQWTSIYSSSNKKNWICEKHISCSP
ncbi:C-type lectin domain family 4 member G-like isoform X2 [Mugil cephalus]|uniref:C-type lectin domain family 4 member G-like isoform X2 n=1 Tax=Mugil cephalus TaxID=48193 RepID=UPI001FB84F75|nr:C-type lectin domain family 4 member G-like isoform X2 [Mugil cephalus]